MEVPVSSGLPQGQRLWVQQTWVWHKPSWRRSPLTPPQSCQTLHNTRKQTLGGHKQNLVCTRTQEKGAVTPQETDPDLPVSVQESPAEVWVGGGLLQGWGTECISVCMRPFESGCHYFHYLLHSLASGQITRKEHSLAYQQTIGLKIY